jgi:hypothetical protein
MADLRKGLLLIIVTLAMALSGCATSPEPYDSGAEKEIPTGPGEMQEGPGLFSGEDGYFTIYKQPASSERESSEKAEDLQN